MIFILLIFADFALLYIRYVRECMNITDIQTELIPMSLLDVIKYYGVLDVRPTDLLHIKVITLWAINLLVAQM